MSLYVICESWSNVLNVRSFFPSMLVLVDFLTLLWTPPSRMNLSMDYKSFETRFRSLIVFFFFFNVLISLVFSLARRFNKHFLMNVLASYWFTLVKLKERNFGTTWSVWRLKRHVKSGSTVLFFLDPIIFLQLHYQIYQLSYFCISTVLKLPKFHCTINLIKEALAWRADDSPRPHCHQRKSRKKRLGWAMKSSP